MRAKVNVLPTDSEKYKKFDGKLFETTVGRLLFNSILPNDFPFMNEEITAKKMSKIVDEAIVRYGIAGAPTIIDKLERKRAIAEHPANERPPRKPCKRRANHA